MKAQQYKSAIVRIGWKMFFPFITFLFAGFQVQAQSSKPQYWFTYNHTGRFSDRWSYAFDLNYRSAGVLPFDSKKSAARMGMTYHTKTNIRITAGYAWFGLNVSGLDQNWLNENRVYQQVQYQHGKSKLNFVHRIRLEQRWREQFVNTGYKDVTRIFSMRYRYHFQVDGPIGRSSSKTTTFRWQAANEFFFHNKETIGYMLFDQNRTLAGVLISPKKQLTLALLYQFIVQQQPVQRELIFINSFRITLFHNLDLRKKKIPLPIEVPVVD